MKRDPVKQNLNGIRLKFCNEVFALIDQANAQGVDVRQPCAVDRVQLAQENEVRVLTGAGLFSARIIVDATGRGSWLSRHLGIARGRGRRG
jgi:flavin-dependent dehydrogenase